MLVLVSACGGGSGGASDAGGDTGGGKTDPGETTGSTEGDTPLPVDPEITLVEPLPAPRMLLPDMSVARANFEGDHHSGSAACSSCHTDDSPPETSTMSVFEQDTQTHRDVSIGTAWESSTMANSFRDPYWQAIYATELDHYPTQEEEINDTCTRCHAPMASDLAKKEGLDLRLFDHGSETEGTFEPGLLSMDDSSELYNHAADGVSCSLCHQIADDGNLGTDASMTGGFLIEQYPAENRAERPAYGQYTDVNPGYMQDRAEFRPVYGAHISTSETCATCHNLNSHSLDRDGNELEGPQVFAEQAMFTEWQLSDYNTAGGAKPASCQSCHMPKLDQPVRLANAGSDIERSDFAEHTFLAANTVMQSMMRDFSDELGIDPSIDFDAAIERNREFLTTSATLEVTPVSASNGVAGFDVDVVNNTGHKLPSGYHSRRVYLHVVVTDANGAVAFESGAINSRGQILGVSEDVDPSTFEPHYDTITDARQVQVYQAIMGNHEGNRTHSLLNGFNYLKDNRLTPSGFNKNTAPVAVEVTGAASSDDDFNLGKDTVSYRVPVAGEGPWNVRAELRYQPIAFGHIAKIFAESGHLDAVDRFRTIYDATELRDETIATATGVVQ